METLEGLSKSIKASQEMKKVVATMKSLAMVNIKRYENAAKGLVKYLENVEMGLYALIRKIDNSYKVLVTDEAHNNSKVAVIVIGSNQGLCGKYNERTSEYTVQQVGKLGYNLEDCNFITVGDRLQTFLELKKIKSYAHFGAPSSVNGVRDVVRKLLLTIEQLRHEQELDKVIIIYTHYISAMSSGELKTVQILPLSREYFKEIAGRPELQELPEAVWRGDPKKIFFGIMRQITLILLHKSIMMAMAAEQANRLNTLQNAESNILDLIDETRLRYNQKRQTVVTSELIDVVSGYQVSKRRKQAISKNSRTLMSSQPNAKLLTQSAQ